MTATCDELLERIERLADLHDLLSGVLTPTETLADDRSRFERMRAHMESRVRLS
jgi:hypothetical protein